MPPQIAEAVGRDLAAAAAGLGPAAELGREVVPEAMEAGPAKGGSNKFK